MIAALPRDSAGVREERALVATVSSDHFWLVLDETKWTLLSPQVAPLMRYLGGLDLAALAFRARCVDCAGEILSGNPAGAAERAAAIQQDLMRLPLDHPDVAPSRDGLVARYTDEWPAAATLDEVLQLRHELASIMHLRQSEPTHIITLDLQDAFKEQQWVVVGPEGREFDVEDYRRQVEGEARRLAGTHPGMLKVATGEPLTDADIAAIEDSLNRPDLLPSGTSIGCVNCSDSS